MRYFLVYTRLINIITILLDTKNGTAILVNRRAKQKIFYTKNSVKKKTPLAPAR